MTRLPSKKAPASPAAHSTPEIAESPAPATDAGAGIIKTTKCFHFQVTSGPMPSADELTKYEAVVPGMAERLLVIHESETKLLQDQTRHRITLESNVISGDGKRAWAGLVAGVLITVGGMVYSYSLALHGYEWLAAVGVLAPLGGLVSVFVHGTNSRRAERLDRVRALSKALRQEQGDTGTE